MFVLINSSTVNVVNSPKLTQPTNEKQQPERQEQTMAADRPDAMMKSVANIFTLTIKTADKFHQFELSSIF